MSDTFTATNGITYTVIHTMENEGVKHIMAQNSRIKRMMTVRRPKGRKVFAAVEWKNGQFSII